MCYETVRNESVLIFTINRPDKRNAINYEVMEGLSRTIDEAANDDQVKALIITGQGESAFCSGGDVEVFHQLKTSEEAYGMLSAMGKVLYKLATLPKITAAFINGIAIGGGSEIAAACDFRFACKEAKIGFVQANLGITTGWGGGTLLYERLAPSAALQLLTSAAVLDSEVLKEIGFVDHITESRSLGDVIEKLQPIIQKHAPVLSAYKKILIEKWKTGDLQERMRLEVKECAVLWEQDEHHRAVEDFLKNKKS